MYTKNRTPPAGSKKGNSHFSPGENRGKILTKHYENRYFVEIIERMA